MREKKERIKKENNFQITSVTRHWNISWSILHTARKLWRKHERVSGERRPTGHRQTDRQTDRLTISLFFLLARLLEAARVALGRTCCRKSEHWTEEGRNWYRRCGVDELKVSGSGSVGPIALFLGRRPRRIRSVAREGKQDDSRRVFFFRGRAETSLPRLCSRNQLHTASSRFSFSPPFSLSLLLLLLLFPPPFFFASPFRHWRDSCNLRAEMLVVLVVQIEPWRRVEPCTYGRARWFRCRAGAGKRTGGPVCSSALTVSPLIATFALYARRHASRCRRQRRGGYPARWRRRRARHSSARRETAARSDTAPCKFHLETLETPRARCQTSNSGCRGEHGAVTFRATLQSRVYNLQRAPTY